LSESSIPSSIPAPRFFQAAPGKPRLAHLSRPATAPGKPGLFWLGGFRSDMRGSKASFLDELAAEQGVACLRFDYSGHGESEGEFADGCIGDWAAEALAIFRAQTEGPQIIVGSSMGGWIALLLARALAEAGETERLAGMVLIAPATDFTETLLWPQLPESVREQVRTQGFWRRPSSPHGEGFVFTRRLFEDGREHSLFGGEIRTYCPVRILQGMADADVPWRHAMELVEHLAGDPVVVTLIRDGDHRLARPQDLALLRDAIASLM
jgi:pimeloyl-ACP methyl ester carboxylesterase